MTGVLAGDSDTAMDFGFQDEYVSVPNAADLNPASITLEAWVKPATTSQIAGAAVITKGTGNGGEAYSIDIVPQNNTGPARYRFYFWWSGTLVELWGPAVTASWTHLVATRSNAGDLAFYVNALRYYQGSGFYGQGANSSPVSVGARQSAFAGGPHDLYFDGVIDEVAVYDKVLTQAQIDAHYAAASALPATLPVDPDSGGWAERFPSDPLGGGYSRNGVHTFTGNFSSTEVDIAIPGRGPAPFFSRTYNSTDSRPTELGIRWSHSYAMRLRAPTQGSLDVDLVGPQGRTDHFTRRPDGTYAPPVGVYTTLVKGGDGTYTATHPDQSTWSFASSGRLTAIADRYGNRSLLTYGADGRLAAVADPAGRGSLTFAYDTCFAARLCSVTDWTGRSVRFGYDSKGRLDRVTDRENNVTRYTNDLNARLASVTDARGTVVLSIVYNQESRASTIKDARGQTSGQQANYAYVTNRDGTLTTTVTYPATSFEPTWRPTQEDTYDLSGRLVKRVWRPTSASNAAITETFAFDSKSNLTAHTNGRGFTTNFCFDVAYDGATVPGSSGNLTRVIAPAPASGAARPVTLLKYDSGNNLVQEVPPTGVASGSTVTCATPLTINSAYATDHEYDASKTRLERVTRRFTDPEFGAQTSVTTYAYGDSANPGLVTKVVPPRGNASGDPDSHATRLTYFEVGLSQSGMLQSSTDPLGNRTTFDYDAAGRRTSAVDALGNAAGGVAAEHTWRFAFDGEDRLIRTESPPVSLGGAPAAVLVTEQGFDAVGNQTHVKDAGGQIKRHVYDERSLLKEVHVSETTLDPAGDPNRIVTAYEYDHLGNLSRAKRAAGHATDERVTDYAYDGLNRQRKETVYPSWPTTTGGLVTEFTYDANDNRLTLKSPLGQTTTHVYDQLDRLTKLDYTVAGTTDTTFTYDLNGNRRTMVDGTGTTAYDYDEWDRLKLVTGPSAAGSKTVGYRYDLDGNRRQLIYPGGSRVSYTVDAGGRLERLTDWADRVTRYEYRADGAPLRAINEFNGTTTDFAHDAARRLTQLSHDRGATNISRHTYLLDAAGRRQQVDEQVAGGALGTITYDYDGLGQIKQVVDGGALTSYVYDRAGNRKVRARGTETTYAYDRADRITSSTTGAATTSYTVNAAGNQTARGADAFAYDQVSRMTSATVGGTASTYAYDGDGNRASMTTGGATTRYVYDASGDVPVLLDDGATRYVWGATGLAYLVSGTGAGTPVVHHADGLGSIRALTDSTGTVVQAYQNDEFGIPTQQLGGQPFRFAGEQRDASTGLINLRARMYDPQTGRFLQRDPFGGVAGSPQSQYPYAYAHNDPVNLTDPRGQYVETALDLAFIGYDIYALATGGWDNAGWNALALGADVVGAALPFATGLGAATRGARAASQLSNVAQAASHACSFTPETLVATPDGPRAIGEIKVGDLVLAFDEASGATVVRAVTAVWVNDHATVLRVTVTAGDGAREDLVTTADHPFFADARGWVPAGELRPGDRVRTASGGFVTITLLAAEATAQPMWNLTVDGAHTYFVGGEQLLVHNTCPVIKPNWGVNRVRKELYRSGYLLESPTKSGGGLMYRNAVSGERVRIMPRPRHRNANDPVEKHLNDYYYRYRTAAGAWQPHTTIPNKHR